MPPVQIRGSGKRTTLFVQLLVRLPQSHTDVIRPDQEPVLKIGGEFDSPVGSSPTASA